MLMFMRLKEMRIYLIFQDWSDVDEFECVAIAPIYEDTHRVLYQIVLDFLKCRPINTWR